MTNTTDNSTVLEREAKEALRATDVCGITQENAAWFGNMLRALSVQERVRWAMKVAKRPVVTTNFRPYEAALLHACTTERNNIPIIWCDTGYNTTYTYAHALNLIDRLSLNVHIYTPLHTAAYRTARMGGIPQVGDALHAEFTEEVKLEPFRRALAEHNPDVWFTNIRFGQTAVRSALHIVSIHSNGAVKISPFFFYTDEQLDDYMRAHDLLNETRYFDPTKGLENRECGLHTS